MGCTTSRASNSIVTPIIPKESLPNKKPIN